MDKKIKVSIWGIAILAVLLAGAKITTNILQVGRKTAEDITIQFDKGSANNPFIRWSDSGGKLQFSNDGVNPLDLGSGSGGTGEINYQPNPNAVTEVAPGSFPNGVGDWVASDSSLVVEKTTTTSEMPRGTIRASGIKITNSGAGTGYVRTRVLLSEADRLLALLKNGFSYRTGAGYVDDDLKIEVWKNASNDFSGAFTQLKINGVDSLSLKDGTFNVAPSFTPQGAVPIELRWVRVGGVASSKLVINDHTVGTGQPNSGSSDFPVEKYTVPVTSSTYWNNNAGLTNQGAEFSMQRLGNALHAVLTVYATGTGTDVGDFQFKVPAYQGQNLTFPSGVNAGGTMRYLQSGDETVLAAWGITSGNNTIGFSNNASTALAGNTIGGITNRFTAFSLTMLLPVNEWQGSTTQFIRDSGASQNSSISLKKSGGQAIPGTSTDTLVTWDATPEDLVGSGFSFDGTGTITVNFDGTVIGQVSLTFGGGTGNQTARVFKNATEITNIFNTLGNSVPYHIPYQVPVVKGDTLTITAASTGANNVTGTPTVVRWSLSRKVESQPGQLIGVPEATGTKFGLAPPDTGWLPFTTGTGSGQLDLAGGSVGGCLSNGCFYRFRFDPTSSKWSMDVRAILVNLNISTNLWSNGEFVDIDLDDGGRAISSSNRGWPCQSDIEGLGQGQSWNIFMAETTAARIQLRAFSNPSITTSGADVFILCKDVPVFKPSWLL